MNKEEKENLRNMTKDQLEEILNNLTKSIRRTERVFKIISGCRTYGSIDLAAETVCDDPECTTCMSFKRIFEEEAKKWAKE